LGVVSWGKIDVLVGEATEGRVEDEAGTRVSGKDVGAAKEGAGVLVRGCRRYDPVMAIAVRVLLALRTSASLAGPPEAIQMRIIKPMNRPVTPSACK
jgi:hypothetical protein